jgi:predicted RND superfamily exporter protein
MTDWPQSLVRVILGRPNTILVLAALLTVIAAAVATRISFNNSIDIWFLEDDTDVRDYKHFHDRFGGDEIAIVGVFAADVFHPDCLSVIERITQAAADAPFAQKSVSLTSKGQQSPATLKRTVLDSPLERGTLVASDGAAAAVIVEMSKDGNTVEAKSAFVRALRVAAEAERRNVSCPNLRIHLSGTPVLDETVFRYSSQELQIIGPVTLALVLVGAFLLFRSLSAALIPLGVVFASTIWTFGLMAATHVEMTLLSSALTPLIMAVGVADSIHILAEYHRRLAGGASKTPAVHEAVTHLLVPCVLTSVTTIAGLLSLLVSPLAPVREFAVFAAAGAFFAFLLSMIVVPAVLLRVRPPRPEWLQRRHTSIFARLLAALGRPRRSAQLFTIAFSTVIVLGALWSVRTLEIGVSPLSWFPAEDVFRTDTEEIDSALGGSTSLEFLVQSPPGGLKDPTVLRRLDDFERWLEKNEAVSKVISVVDVLKEATRNPTAPEGMLPKTREAVERFYRLLESQDDFDRLIQNDYSIGRISARVRLTEAVGMVDELYRIEERLATTVNDDRLNVQMTGYVKLMGQMEGYLIESQIKSFATAFAVITLVMMVLLRSWRFAILAMIPNFTPIVIGAGVMSVAGIGLTPGTVMIGAIALGLVVDDSVHFLVGLRRNLGTRSGDDVPDLGEALRKTLLETGPPIIATSLLLAAAFLVLMLGHLGPTVHFGIVTAVVILVAMVADLVLLPAVVLLFKPRL